MKILVVQLLRMGDVVMSTPVLKGLRKKYPEAQIEILINKECRKIGPFLPEVSKVHYFDRSGLQDSIAHGDRSLLEAFSRLRVFFDEINSNQYDLVINLTHTRLSGHICSRIYSNEKIGLSIENQTPEFGGSWFQFLNEHGSGEREDCFHFSDIFYYGAQLPGAVQNYSVIEDEDAKSRVLSTFGGIENLVTVQAFTSDTKKNYGEVNWVKFAIRFYALNPQATLVFVGSPAEKESIDKITNHLVSEGYSAFSYICDIGELVSLLKLSTILVSGDTLTKHLGVAVDIPVVEISLGSSDKVRTGPFSENSIVVSSKELCAPCGHSEKCFRTFHACADSVLPSTLAMLAHYRSVDDWESIYQLAGEVADQCEISITKRGELPTWNLSSINEPFCEKAIAKWVSKVSWYLFLQCRDSGGLFEMGTETYKLHKALEMTHSHIEPSDWKYMYAQLSRIYFELEERLSGFIEEVRVSAPKYEDKETMVAIKTELIEMRREFSVFFFLESYLESFDFIYEDSISSPFVIFRRMIMLLTEMRDRLVIEGKVTQSLVSRVEEVYGREI